MANNFFPNITSTAQAITTSLALVTPQANLGYQPQSTTGAHPPTLLFHTEGENTATIQSDITDHFIEDNTSIQDQIALKPELVTVHGFIGELNDVFPVGLPNNGQISAALPNVSSFVPTFTTAGQAAINTAQAAFAQAQAVTNALVSAWGALSGTTPQTVVGSSGLSVNGAVVTSAASLQPQNLQQAVFQQFYLYWRNRTLFTIQTPWAIFSNMAIMELRALQDETTRVITDFYVSFKMLRFSTTFLQTPDQFQGVGRAGITNAYLGQSTPATISLSTLDAFHNITLATNLPAPP